MIWFIGNLRLPWFARCANGYVEAMKEAGLEPHFSEIHSEDRELGYLAVKSLLANGERPTALFVGTDQAASGVYQALQESGIRIPDDISVAGFNDTMGDVLHPGLTTVREFPKELGAHLAEFTLRRLQEPELPPQQLVMPTELIRRESVRRIAPNPVLSRPSASQCFLTANLMRQPFLDGLAQTKRAEKMSTEMTRREFSAALVGLSRFPAISCLRLTKYQARPSLLLLPIDPFSGLDVLRARFKSVSVHQMIWPAGRLPGSSRKKMHLPCAHRLLRGALPSRKHPRAPG
jgi:hypothetical protein